MASLTPAPRHYPSPSLPTPSSLRRYHRGGNLLRSFCAAFSIVENRQVARRSEPFQRNRERRTRGEEFASHRRRCGGDGGGGGGGMIIPIVRRTGEGMSSQGRRDRREKGKRTGRRRKTTAEQWAAWNFKRAALLISDVY